MMVQSHSPSDLAPAAHDDDTAALLVRLESIRADLVRAEAEVLSKTGAPHPRHEKSARNLVHYVALRRHDLRGIQEQLARRGLSSLGRSEPHVLEALDAVITAVTALAATRGTTHPARTPAPGAPGFDEGDRLLGAHTDDLLGAPPPRRAVRIMVTMPSEAATDPALVRQLLAAGMDCMRINCAHDSAATWTRMIEHLRRAQEELGRPCKILMDLAGPKLRTGPLATRPGVLHVSPERDDHGRIVRPAVLWLCPEGDAADDLSDPLVHLPPEFLDGLAPRNELRVADLRDRSRILVVRERRGRRLRCECAGSLWIGEGVKVRRTRKSRLMPWSEAFIGPLPPREVPLVLRPGDELILTRAPLPGLPAERGPTGALLRPATISCTLGEAFAAVRAGEPIWFDDGRLGGTIHGVTPDEIRVRVLHARADGSSLGADRGINLPESRLELPALTAKDRADLAFVAKHADLVGLSFVQRPEDVVALHAELQALGGAHIGVVLKIETQRGFRELPRLLLAAMRAHPFGVMIARGDLAVECGWERLAEVQEEILWISEAAHAPVIWATQVLETMAKKGFPTRAEITDAAMAERAEAVMLNKGAHVVEAVRTLDDILVRMQSHQHKKRARLRPLRLADALFSSEIAEEEGR